MRTDRACTSDTPSWVNARINFIFLSNSVTKLRVSVILPVGCMTTAANSARIWPWLDHQFWFELMVQVAPCFKPIFVHYRLHHGAGDSTCEPRQGSPNLDGIRQHLFSQRVHLLQGFCTCGLLVHRYFTKQSLHPSISRVHQVRDIISPNVDLANPHKSWCDNQ